MQSSIVTAASATSQWQGLVREAQRAAQTELDEQLESYLVFLLMRFMGDTRVAARVLALDYLEGMQAAGSERQLRLRDVGDRCLLVSGLFPQRAVRRRVSVGYFVRLGRGAYGHLAERLESSLADLYIRLEKGFVVLMDTLHALRDLDVETRAPVLTPLQAFDLWQETGSRSALRELRLATRAVTVRIGDDNIH